MPEDTKPFKLLYHVFCDGYDDWFEELEEAEKSYKELKNADENVRLYEEIFETEEEYEDGECSEENCLLSHGSYPM